MAKGFEYWAKSPDHRLGKSKPPYNPEWCAAGLALLEWGKGEVTRVAEDPYPDTLMQAKVRLVDRYVWDYLHATDEHRPDKDGGNHACIHKALMQTWRCFADIAIKPPLPEPPPERVVPGQPAIDVPPEPSVREEPGIDLGHEEPEPEREPEPTES